MKKLLLGLLAVPLLAVAIPGVPAQAQLLNALQGATGSGQGSALGSAMSGLGGLSGSSVGSASTSNIAGVLQYCVQNNFVSGGSASSVKDALVNKVTGSGGASSSQFTEGSQGVLQAGGQNVQLGGSSLKEQLTQRVCSEVLKRAKSLL
ncbi:MULTISPECIES: DUF2501 domain-containing protein [unclassified Acidisoma]|uniref:DUF2501 domain-containing protein n=1 Tax=unclassified Acidisoma TaxID=2634065 RepID=UPI00131B3943|nr:MULTISPECIES: DUF2501 domain-containing protein [unclassified Acidisoma]